MSKALGIVGVMVMGVACSAGGVAGSGTSAPDKSPAASDAPSSTTASGNSPGGLQPGAHVYQTSATVGDFLTVTIDKGAKTASYVNKTNGLAAEGVTYEQDGDGVYTFHDPNGHLLAGVELEDEALVLDVDHAGPHTNTRALAIGAGTRKIALTDFKSRQLNMMQFRTRNGGMEVGNVALEGGPDGLSVDLQSYWPLGGLRAGDKAFHVGSKGALPVREMVGEHDYLTLSELQGEVASTDYVFKTASGFTIDMANGNIVMFEQPASKAFDPSWGGAYRAMLYAKTGASGAGDDQPEPGDTKVAFVDVGVSAAGHVVVSYADGTKLVDDDLLPVADAPHIVGQGKLDPSRCNGIFTYRRQAGAGWEDVFVMFTPKGVLLSSFTPGQGQGYDYFYAAGVKR